MKVKVELEVEIDDYHGRVDDVAHTMASDIELKQKIDMGEISHWCEIPQFKEK